MRTQPLSEGSPYLPSWAEISRIEPLTESEKLFELRLLDGRALGHQPGQFVELSIMGMGEAPLSVSSPPTPSPSFELAIRRMGNVTAAAHGLKTGDTVGIRGPFGTCFPVEESRGQDLLVVAGGIGLVPLRSFLKHVLGHRSDYGKLIVLFGARHPSEQLFVEELREWRGRSDLQYLETVDRPDASWKGHVGVITTLFPKVQIDPARTFCIAVGPPVMYRFVILEARGKGIPNGRIYLSLERRMKCGIGKCGHCQINHLYACRDGPVFTYADIVKVKEAL